MPVDRAAERMALLEIANREGTLNNESAFRDKLEQFQNRYREQRPSVIDISTDAEQNFLADLESIAALSRLSGDREVRQLCAVVTRCLQYLGRCRQKS